MEGFQRELLQQELQGARDAATAMEQQLQRMHAENAALRDSEGLQRELASTTRQVTIHVLCSPLASRTRAAPRVAPRSRTRAPANVV